MRNILTVSVLVVALAFFGCAGMTDTQQRTLSGGAIGAAGGAAIGAMAGNAGMGAAIGGAAGLAGGYLYDKHKEAEADAYQRGYKAGKKK
jgi:osmotically inducible lipoprotein OsmB